MIARFWDALFDYGDMLREEKRDKEHETLEDIYDILQRVYDNGLSCERVVKDKKPESDLEKFVLSIKDIIVFHDEQDDSYYYDLDGHHFDRPEEVMNYLVDCRKKLQISAMHKVKKEILEYMITKVKSIDVPEMVGKSYPNTVVKISAKDKLTKDYLYEEFVVKHKSMKAIALETGCSDTTVSKYLEKYGYKTTWKGDK